jgi:hypothetical protein
MSGMEILIALTFVAAIVVFAAAYTLCLEEPTSLMTYPNHPKDSISYLAPPASHPAVLQTGRGPEPAPFASSYPPFVT